MGNQQSIPAEVGGWYRLVGTREGIPEASGAYAQVIEPAHRPQLPPPTRERIPAYFQFALPPYGLRHVIPLYTRCMERVYELPEGLAL